MKKALIMLTMSVLVISFTACGSKEDEENVTPTENATTAENVTLAENATTAENATPAENVAEGDQSSLKDGVYTATAKVFDADGWLDHVTVTISGGKITVCEWNAVHKEGGADKKAASKSGDYVMVEQDGASPWHEQVATVEAAFVSSQGTEIFEMNSDGMTDTIAGVTIHVDTFVTLAEECLAQARA